LIKGVVQKILVNPQYGLTSFTIKGQDGFYSLGKDKPTFKEGDAIQFETNPVGRYTYAKDIAPWADGGTTSGEPVSRVASAASSGSYAQGNSWKGRGGSQRGSSDAAAKEAYWRAKEERDLAKEGEYANTQKRIEVQAARNAAIETAGLMWQHNLLPKGVDKIKQQDKYDAFMALVEELTDSYLKSTASRLNTGSVNGDSDAVGQGVAEAVSAGTDSEEANGGNWD
jgi:hypothetical protein